jgi:hypothetical protein
MRSIVNFSKYASFMLVFGLAVAGCQKMERPELKELILDPPPPPLPAAKSMWSFEENVRDSGQFRFTSTAKNVTYVTGINGKAAQIGADGYIVMPTVTDSLKTLGSFTIAFWMKGVGPVKDGAQGLFSIGNRTEFWGNIDMFLENNDNPSEAFLKVHMFNASVASGNGEEWNEVKIPNALNKWTHIAVVYNGTNSQFSIFADGVPTTLNAKVLRSGAYGPISFANVNGMVLGNYQFETDPSLTTTHGKEDWAYNFKGTLDQFRLYNVPLTAAQINALYKFKL